MRVSLGWGLGGSIGEPLDLFMVGGRESCWEDGIGRMKWAEALGGAKFQP